MTNNMYLNYDPLYANGILPARVNDILFSGAPAKVNPALPYIEQQNLVQTDKYTPTFKNPNPIPFWKKALFGTGIALLTLWGLRKMNINPLGKLISALKLDKAKDFVVNKFNNVGNFIKNIFKKPTP